MPIFCYSSHALLKFFTLSNLDNYIEHYMVTINAVIICGCVCRRLLNSPNLVALGLSVKFKTWGWFQYSIRRLIVRSCKAAKPQDWLLKSLHCFGIWQAHRQHCCWGACQISEWLYNSKYKSCGFETLRNLTIRCLMGYWNRAQSPIGSSDNGSSPSWPPGTLEAGGHV